MHGKYACLMRLHRWPPANDSVMPATGWHSHSLLYLTSAAQNTTLHDASCMTTYDADSH